MQQNHQMAGGPSGGAAFVGAPGAGAGAYSAGAAGYTAAHNGNQGDVAGYNGAVVSGAPVAYNGAMVSGAPAASNGAVISGGSPMPGAAYGGIGGGAYSGVGVGPGMGSATAAAGSGGFCVNQGCVAAGFTVTGEAAMSFVGPGRGDYVTETTYKYVGAGAGDLAVTAPRSVAWGRVLAAGLLVLGLGGAGIALLAAPGTPSTSPKLDKSEFELPDPHPAPQVHGECTFWGDPHLRTFDGGRPSFYGEGEYYIVKSDKVVIQGRYMGTKYTAGLAATNKIVVGGPFLEGHTIAVGALDDGPIIIDGLPALTTFPSTQTIEGVGVVTYSSEGKLVDEATAEWDRKIVKMQLPEDVVVEVFRWSNYLDLRITMKKQEGQDGSCGNWNGNIADDSTEAIFSRIGAQVPQGELIFNHRATEHLTDVEEELLARCPQTKLQEAQIECRGDDLSSTLSSVRVKSCMLDWCYGSNEHALRMAKTLGLVDEDSAADQTESV